MSPPPPLTSAKVVLLDAGEAYVAAGYPHNHRRFQRALDALWRATPANGQRIDRDGRPLRAVAVDALERIIGPIDRHYAVVRWRMAPCPPAGVCRPAVAELEVVPMRVEAAVLSQWGCEDETVPLVRLGRWPWAGDGSYPEAVAVGGPPAGSWRVERPAADRLPAILRTLVSADGVIAAATARGGTASFVLLDRSTEVAQRYTVVPAPVSQPPTLIDAHWPIDGRC